MVQVPLLFQRRMVPLSPEQWTVLRDLLRQEMRRNPYALKGPGRCREPTRFSSGADWNYWFEDFMRRDDVRQVFSQGYTAGMWARIHDCMWAQAAAVASYERRKIRKEESRKAAKPAGDSIKDSEAGQAPGIGLQGSPCES